MSGSNGTSPGTDPDAGLTQDQIEADIERQRAELAATVNALQARLDVKTRARHKAADLRERATTDSGRPRPAVAAGAVVVVALVVGGLVLRHRRKH